MKTCNHGEDIYYLGNLINAIAYLATKFILFKVV